MLILTSYKIGEVHFRLLGTNGFHVKAKNGRFAAAGSRCRQNHKYEISRRCLADYVRKLQQKRAARAARLFFLFILFNQLNSLLPTTPENNDLIGWIRKNNRAACAARFLVQFFDVACQMTISKFKVLTTTLTHSSKSFILYIYFNAFY